MLFLDSLARAHDKPEDRETLNGSNDTVPSKDVHFERVDMKKFITGKPFKL
jgi:hypothetical protein